MNHYIRSTHALWDAHRTGRCTIRATTTDPDQLFQERQNTTLAAVEEFEKQKAVREERIKALEAWQVETWPEYRDAADALHALWNLNGVVRHPPPDDSKPYAAWIPYILTYGRFIQRNGLAPELDRPVGSVADRFGIELLLAAANGASEAKLKALLEARYKSGFLASDFTWQNIFNLISGLVGQHFNRRTRQEFPELFPASRASSPVPDKDVNPSVELGQLNDVSNSALPPKSESRTISNPGQPSGKKGKNIDARMLKALQDDPSRISWSAKNWATFLGCGKGTVGESKTWKMNIIGARALEKADRARQGKDEPRRDDRRRGRQK